MAVALEHKRSGSRLAQAVFALDRYLRRRNGIFEYSDHPECLFRIETLIAGEPIGLRDGTRAQPGDPLVKIHFWNEHMLPMGRRGATVGWARRVHRAVELSMRELAHYLARRPDLARVRVLFGDMRLGTALQTEQFHRIIARYGFEPALPPHQGRQNTLHRIGDTILILMLVLATNPVALRHAPLRRHRTRVYLSRVRLDADFGTTPGAG